MFAPVSLLLIESPPVSDGLPEALRAFLHEKQAGKPVRSLSQIRVTLGPYNKSWWAHDGTQYRWHNLPAGLSEELESRRKPGGGWTMTPRLVALGASDNYVMITDGHGGAWHLSSYRELDQMLDLMKEDADKRFSMIHNIFLHPYRLQCAILQSRNGHTMGQNLPPHIAEPFESISQTIQKDTSAKIQQERRIAELQSMTGELERLNQQLRSRERQATQRGLSDVTILSLMTALNMNPFGF